MSNADPRGKFVWHELLSGDAAAATAFYTKVVPWKSQPWEQDSSYHMWVARNGPVGGIAKTDGSAPPHWLAYVAVSDVNATAEQAKGLGGRVLKGKTDLPNGGSYAVLADPQGAEFAVYQSGGETGNGAQSATPGAGEFSWHELATTDAKAAMEFYTKLLGWETGPVHDMGPPAGNYHLFLHQGNQYGGMFVSDSSGAGPSWLCYISVEDVGKAATAAKNAGGRVMNGPMEVPGGSWIAQVLDSEGAPFAVHEAAKAAAAKPAAKPATKPASKPKAEKAAAPAAAPAAAKPAEAKPAEAKPAAKPAAAPAAAAPAAKPAAKPAAAKAPAKAPAKAAPAKAAPAKAAAKKGKKAAAKKAPARKVAKKAAAKGKAKAAAKKGKKVARKAAPAKKKAKAKKHK